MLRRGLLISLFVLGSTTPSYAQLEVHDSSNLAQNIIQVARLVRQIQILTEQLEDMKVQAELGNPAWNTQTAQLLRLLGELGQASSVLYTHDGSQNVWENTYTEDEVVTDGTWREKERARSHATIQSQRDLLRLVEERRRAVEEDAARMERLQMDLSNAQGRNQIEHANGAIQAEQAWRLAKLEELVSILANSQIVSSVHEVNEKAQREAQEHGFLKNYDREIPKPQFKDHGFLDFKRYGY